MGGERHDPVMVDEVLHFMGAGPASVVVDATVGQAGHAEALMGWRGPGGSAG